MKKITLILSVLALYSSICFGQFVHTGGPNSEASFSYLWSRNDTAFAAKNANLWRTFDGGSTWEVLLEKGLPYQVDPRAITVGRDEVFIGTNNDARIYSSSDWGDTWKAEIDGATALWVPTHADSDGQHVVMGGTTFEPHYFDFDSRKWVSSGLSGVTHAIRFQSDGSVIVNLGSVSKGYSHTSSDGGKTWTQIPSEPPLPGVGLTAKTYDIVNVGNHLVAVTNFNGYHPYYSIDGGNTWEQSEGALTYSLNAYGRKFLVLKDGRILFSKTGQLHISSDSGKTWTNTANLVGIDFNIWKSNEILSSLGTISEYGAGSATKHALSSHGVNLVEHNSKLTTFLATTEFQTSRWFEYDGSTWTSDSLINQSSAFTLGAVYSTSVIGDSLYVCTSNGLYAGTNTEIKSYYQEQLGFNQIGCVAKSGSNFIAGTVETRGNVKPKIYYSSDDKKTWTLATFSNTIGFGAGGTANYFERFFEWNGKLYADMNGGFAVSTDNGQTWEWKGGQNGGNVVGAGGVLVRLKDPRINLGSPKTIEYSTDGGDTWIEALDGIPGYTGQSNFTDFGDVFEANGKIYLVAKNQSHALVVFDEATKKWTSTSFNSTIPVLAPVRDLVEVNGVVYISIEEHGVYKNDGSAFASSPAMQPVRVFPNPAHDFVFFSIDKPEVVYVFDALGRKVEAHFNGKSLDVSSLSAGSYTLKVLSNHTLYYAKLCIK